MMSCRQNGSIDGVQDGSGVGVGVAALVAIVGVAIVGVTVADTVGVAVTVGVVVIVGVIVTVGVVTCAWPGLIRAKLQIARMHNSLRHEAIAIE